ncbi:hypothetical protein ACWD04_23755 [Streptomyces sp. NPDC002911]
MDRVREGVDDGRQHPAATCTQHHEIVEAADGVRVVCAVRTHVGGIRRRLEFQSASASAPA